MRHLTVTTLTCNRIIGTQPKSEREGKTMADGDMATTKLHVYMDSWRERQVRV